MKVLALVIKGLGRPAHDEILHLQATDKFPRIALYGDTLECDLLDERYLARMASQMSAITRMLPVPVQQVLEAFRAKKDYDVVISWAEQLGLPLALLLKGTGARTPHVCIFSWISGAKKAHFLKTVQSHIDRLVLMSSVQHEFARNVLKMPPTKLSLLRWPVDEKFWRPMNAPANMICTVGSEMRDFPTFIRATRDLEIRCHIAAGAQRNIRSPWMAAIDKEGPLPAHISVGGKSPFELRELYAQSKLVVVPILPTDTDNGTTTILEAMAMGKAVICSRVKGQADVIRDGENGLFVPPCDPRALREAILHLWNNPDVAHTMGMNGRRFIEKHHTLNGFMADLKRVLEEVTAHPRSDA